jgi:hypothetical protein
MEINSEKSNKIGEKPGQRHVVYHEFYMESPGTEGEVARWEATT